MKKKNDILHFRWFYDHHDIKLKGYYKPKIQYVYLINFKGYFISFSFELMNT